MYRGTGRSSHALYRAIQKVERKAKYGNRKVELDGETFDSMKEANRWAELKLMERAGEIHELQRQVPYVLIPTQRDENGRVIEREVKYIADFTYRVLDNGRLKLIVEDTKGMKTREYVIKRKLMLYRYGLRIREV